MIETTPIFRNPKARGEFAEAAVLARLLRAGLSVCLPFGNNLRYDLVIDNGDRLVRAQVKTGRLERGAVRFKTASVNGFTGKRTPYHGQIDVFLVYCPELDAVYRVPVDRCGVSRMGLRVDVVRGNSGTAKSVRLWAADFVI